MATPTDFESVPEGFVPLVASLRLHGDPDRVAALLANGGTPWEKGRLAHPLSGELRRFEVDMRLRIGGETAALSTLRKAAYLDFGRPRRTAAGWEAEISWRASTAAPLFPVFSGWLSIGPAELRIEGLYAPPYGLVGRVADRMLLHVAANATARWVLNEIDLAAVRAAA